MRLYPHEVFIESLKKDSERMTDMFFGEPPDFNKTMSEIKRIETIINTPVGSITK
jgi:hypothetical protein